MQINDSIFGTYTIEPVLTDLIKSKPVQRLKGIHQGGASYLVNENWNVTRYEHSIGVMLLIRKLGGCIEEQIAGLLHDISHTAFSHVIDFALENQEEDYHEKIFEKVLLKSEIPDILHKYGFDYKNIVLDDSQWSILEQPSPDLCADRVDYTLRDMYHYEKISKEDVDRFLDSLAIVDGKICLNNLTHAEWFVETYHKEVIDFFMDPLNIFGYDRLAGAIKHALERDILILDDLFEEDEDVIQKLVRSGDSDIMKNLNELHDHVEIEENESDYDLHRKNKVRVIDPLVNLNHQLIRASEVSESIRKMNRKAYEKAVKGTYVKMSR
ncbi:HD domain-containing protein [Tenuibacillus multivorans]|uniref:HD domain-containing protein n=1 Tax=Tenuibacillus multivorans TaxID=237069 RepID=A0A1G9WL53_9BACI|nr:HD domain-containing protein [Tenuibacillus multivorans]GEL78021.1 hypothetical protein TMU01_22560 [Tenuibacillus multivorans]SDM85230.1 hypothetical protein SAMN05216498_0794 [Tenuibacillus multivorans]